MKIVGKIVVTVVALLVAIAIASTAFEFFFGYRYPALIIDYRAGNRVALSFSNLARQVDVARATHIPRLSVAAAIRRVRVRGDVIAARRFTGPLNRQYGCGDRATALIAGISRYEKIRGCSCREATRSEIAVLPTQCQLCSALPGTRRLARVKSQIAVQSRQPHPSAGGSSRSPRSSCVT